MRTKGRQTEIGRIENKEKRQLWLTRRKERQKTIFVRTMGRALCNAISGVHLYIAKDAVSPLHHLPDTAAIRPLHGKVTTRNLFEITDASVCSE